MLLRRLVTVALALGAALIAAGPATSWGAAPVPPAQGSTFSGGGGSTGLPTKRRVSPQNERNTPIQPPPGGGA